MKNEKGYSSTARFSSVEIADCSKFRRKYFFLDGWLLPPSSLYKSSPQTHKPHGTRRKREGEGREEKQKSTKHPPSVPYHQIPPLIPNKRESGGHRIKAEKSKKKKFIQANSVALAVEISRLDFSLLTTTIIVARFGYSPEIHKSRGIRWGRGREANPQKTQSQTPLVPNALPISPFPLPVNHFLTSLSHIRYYLPVTAPLTPFATCAAAFFSFAVFHRMK